MASAAEQMAQNISWSTFGKAKELQQRILFAIALLIVYRIGTFIPVPGINTVELSNFMQDVQQGVGGILSMFTGGALGRFAIFALGIMPYISASIIVQLMTAMVPQLEQLKKEGEQGRKKINQYTRMLTVVLALFQAWGMTQGLQGQEGLVLNPGFLTFQLPAVITLVGGTMFLMWLGEQITARGIGNGISLIIFVGIIAELPAAMAQFFELGRNGSLSAGWVVGIIVMVIAVIAFVVFVERALRKILIQYPRRQVGQKMYGGENSHLPIKVNPAGVIPPIFASALLLLPTTISTFSGTQTSPFMNTLLAYFGPGQPLYLLFFVVMIVFFSYFYTANVSFKTDDVAENLKKQGGFVPGIRPGKRTEEYLDYVTTRVLVLGSAYLSAVCLLPEILRSELAIPFYFGGTSLLIVVSVTMDTINQVQSHLLAHQYEGLIEKSRLRTKDRSKARAGQRKKGRR
ncbi:MAG: preprotein translocase subunit SecY [Pseudomonadota bacterium]